jgi:hypothetical protein
VDDSGRYCLWPFKSGPTSESPWEYADMYKIKGLLPLNESTVVNYKEYEIKKYCFLGTIGMFPNVSNILVNANNKLIYAYNIF